MDSKEPGVSSTPGLTALQKSDWPLALASSKLVV
jgi:hypothetical protein